MKHEDPVTSQDILCTGEQFGAATKLMRDLHPLATVMNAVMETIDPEQFNAMAALRNSLRDRFSEFDALCGIDPAVHEGLAILVNSQSVNFKDKQVHPNSWALMTTLGSFQGGDLYFSQLGIKVRFASGDFIAIRSQLLNPEMDVWVGGLRVSLLYFTQESLWEYMGRELSLRTTCSPSDTTTNYNR
jgi:hypothetical protein